MKISVITPTFNRSHLLPQLYKSLTKQTIKDQLIWIVVDDGSEDDTEGLIHSYMTENLIKIKYLRQKNAGKHTAVNSAFKTIDTAYFMVIDSDDFLRETAMEKCLQLINEINNNEKIVGFTFILVRDLRNINLDEFGNFRSLNHSEYEMKIKGEMIFCYRIRIAHEFPYPEFKDEKFIQESIVHHRIGEKFKVLYTDNILAFGEFQSDGLTANFYQLLKRNPHGSMLTMSEKLKSTDFSRKEKLQYAKTYWEIALNAKQITWWQKFDGINLKWTIKVFKNKVFK